jgi:outer membrane protein assembly factor BamB
VAQDAVFVSGVTGLRTRYGYGARGTVAALDAKTGKVRWRYTAPTEGPYSKVGSSERAVAGTFDGGVYYQAIPTADTVIAFDAVTGAQRWSFRTQAPVKMSPVVADGRVIFGDGAGLLYQLDARNGAPLKVDLFDEPFATAPPVIVGKAILLIAGTRVYARPF